MTGPAPPTNEAAEPLLHATHAARTGIQVPPARAIVRAFPLDEERQRFLLAAGEGIGDSPSAEAQAAEALGHLEATVSRAAPNTRGGALLETAFGAADDAVARLLRLPGSVPGLGAALVAAVVDDGLVTLANVGRGAAFLVRDGTVRRLTPDQRWHASPPPGQQESSRRGPLGAGLQAEPELVAGPRLEPGDTLLLTSEAVARRLGERVISAVAEEVPVAELAQELADLATGEAGADGAAVALLHVPGPNDAVPLGTAAAAVEATSRRWLLPLAVIAGAILVGAVVMLAALYVASSGGSSPKATPKPTVAASAAALALTPQAAAASAPIVVQTPAAPSATAATAVTAAPAAVASPTVTASPTPEASPSASPVPSTPAPLVASNLAACDSSNLPPCLYTTNRGDSVSTIGDRFSVTAACFEAANTDHLPVAPQPPTHRIGTGEVYVIPATANCTPVAGASAATPRPACTPRPGATAPPPVC